MAGSNEGTVAIDAESGESRWSADGGLPYGVQIPASDATTLPLERYIDQTEVVAREMCRLLDSGVLDDDLDRATFGVDYLIGRLDVRDGDDNPSLQEKWNNWLGQMNYLHDADYGDYQTR